MPEERDSGTENGVAKQKAAKLLQNSGFQEFLLDRLGIRKPLTGGVPDFTRLKFGSSSRTRTHCPSVNGLFR
jgi:hypothetical protein